MGRRTPTLWRRTRTPTPGRRKGLGLATTESWSDNMVDDMVYVDDVVDHDGVQCKRVFYIVLAFFISLPTTQICLHFLAKAPNEDVPAAAVVS